METTQNVQELKAERVQEELALLAEEPFRISLKAERVQVPSVSAVEPAAQGVAAVALNLELSDMRQVRIELPGMDTIITI